MNAIDYLAELFTYRLRLEDNEVVEDDKGDIRISLNTVTFEELLYNTMASLRQYCKHDFVVVKQLLEMLSMLLNQEMQKSYQEALLSEVDKLNQDITNSINNQSDLEKLRKLVKKIQNNNGQFWHQF